MNYIKRKRLELQGDTKVLAMKVSSGPPKHRSFLSQAAKYTKEIIN